MESVTIALPDDLARWVVVRAAENGRSAPDGLPRNSRGCDAAKTSTTLR